MTPQTINTIGLVLGMLGVVIIFLFGPPQPNLEEGVAFGLEDGTKLPDGRTVAERNRDIVLRRRLYSILSKVGLGLVFLGFLCQLIAVHAPNVQTR